MDKLFDVQVVKKYILMGPKPVNEKAVPLRSLQKFIPDISSVVDAVVVNIIQGVS
jgi:hypothetical protein